MPTGIHKQFVANHSIEVRDSLESHRYRLCMDDKCWPDIRDRKTIGDIDHPSSVLTGLERYLKRTQKYHKLLKKGLIQNPL